MYRRPKFLEVLLGVRRQMALEADYDVGVFVQRVCSGADPVTIVDPAMVYPPSEAINVDEPQTVEAEAPTRA